MVDTLESNVMRTAARVLGRTEDRVVERVAERVDVRVDERVDERTQQWQQTVLERPWITIVWNDPVNLMSYVEWVFRSYFGFDRAEARRLMLLVHNEGKAVVATGTREEMERHVAAMHGFGLWASLQKEDA